MSFPEERTSEMTFEELDQALDDTPFLVSLGDGLEEELRIVIAGSAVGEVGTVQPDLEGMTEEEAQAIQGILAKCCPIEMDEKNQYELCFRDYIVYQVRNESYCGYDKEEVRHGRYLIRFESSKLLDRLGDIVPYVCQFEDGTYFPGKWVHYGIYTWQHTIDIISHNPPVIRKVSAEITA